MSRGTRMAHAAVLGGRDVRTSLTAAVGALFLAVATVVPAGAQTAPTVTANASATTSGAIEVTWTEVTGALGYLVVPQRLTVDGEWTAVTGRTQRVTGRRPVIFDALVNGSSYRGCVAAVLADGIVTGLSSVAIPYGLPGAPAVNSVDRQDGTVTVTWSPAADNGRQISAYEVSVAPADVSPVVVGGNETTTQVSGLREGVDYTVSVRASNLRGQGEAGQGEAVAPVSALRPDDSPPVLTVAAVVPATPGRGGPGAVVPDVLLVADEGPCGGATPTSSDDSSSSSSDDSSSASSEAAPTADEGDEDRPTRSSATGPSAPADEDPIAEEEPAPAPMPTPPAPSPDEQESAAPEAVVPAAPAAEDGGSAGLTGGVILAALLALAGLVIGGVVVRQRSRRAPSTV